MTAASHAPPAASRPATVVPRIVICAAAVTVVAGLLIRHLHGGLGTATPPFVMVWGPRLQPLALVSVAAAVLAIVLAPRLVGATDRPASFAARVVALALVLGLALNAARTGTHGWDAIFDTGPAARSRPGTSTCPGCRRSATGTRFFLDRFAELVPSLPVNVAGHPPGLLLFAARVRPDDRGPRSPRCASAPRRAAAPLTYALGSRARARTSDRPHGRPARRCLARRCCCSA